ncbi:hypothetical protein ACIBQX_13545 [Nonomuraea sp. NPDC049714]|uniref:IS1096 element passenger TnpR family protein n=1 Tax=Nonomuraea sp. NPDC049714 TaxID=3364357 RepID=UPI0037877BB6
MAARRVHLPSTATLDQLHQVVQVAMGWQQHHLHLFGNGRPFPRKTPVFPTVSAGRRWAHREAGRSRRTRWPP